MQQMPLSALTPTTATMRPVSWTMLTIAPAHNGCKSTHERNSSINNVMGADQLHPALVSNAPLAWIPLKDWHPCAWSACYWKLLTLDGEERGLDVNDVITVDNKPCSVMGGQATKSRKNRSRVVLKLIFNGKSIRKTGVVLAAVRRLALKKASM